MNRETSPQDQQNPTYRDVRSLRRGLAIIEALSHTGWTRPSELAAATNIDRSSIYRLAKTLIDEGFVLRRREDGALSLSKKVRQIADGIRSDELSLLAVSPHLASLTSEIDWPSDFAMLSRGGVTIQDSTHSLSRVTFHRGVVEQDRSLIDSSLGRAIMMMLTPKELDAALDIAVAMDGPDSGRELDRQELRLRLEEYRRAGYAWAAGAYDPSISAIACGVRGRHGLVGAVNIIFFRRVLSPAAAAGRYLERLKKCVDDIAMALA